MKKPIKTTGLIQGCIAAVFAIDWTFMGIGFGVCGFSVWGVYV